MTLSARLEVKFTAEQTGSNDFGGPDFEPELRKIITLADGVAAEKADILFMDTRTVASASNDDIDLAGSLSSAFGATITAAEIVGIIIDSDAANTTTLSVGAGSNLWFGMFGASGDIIKVFPGGIFVNFARDVSGMGAVTAATADILRIANGSGASATYRIGIVARTA